MNERAQFYSTSVSASNQFNGPEELVGSLLEQNQVVLRRAGESPPY